MTRVFVSHNLFLTTLDLTSNHISLKPATYAYHVKEQFSPSMDSSFNKLTNCQYTSAKFWQVCFCWGLFLRPIKCPWVLGCPLNATGWLVQATTLLEITTWLVDDIGHGFSYVLWQFECNGASLWTISPWKMQSSAVTCHFVAPHHPPPLDKKISEWAIQLAMRIAL